MAFANPTTLAVLQSQLAADAHQLQSFLDWLTDRANAYFIAGILNNSALMNGLGISSTDQTYINAFLTDIGRIFNYMSGNPQNAANVVRVDIDNIIGLA